MYKLLALAAVLILGCSNNNQPTQPIAQLSADVLPDTTKSKVDTTTNTDSVKTVLPPGIIAIDSATLDTVSLLVKGSGITNPLILGSNPMMARKMLARSAVSTALPADIDLGDVKTTTDFSFILKASAPLIGIHISSSDSVVYPVSPMTIASMDISTKATGLVPILKVKVIHGKLGDLDVPVITAANNQVTVSFSGKMLDTIKQYAVRTYTGHTDNGNGKSNDVPVTDSVVVKIVRVDTVAFQGVSYVLSVSPLYLTWSKRWTTPVDNYTTQYGYYFLSTPPVKGILSAEHSTGCRVQTEVRGNNAILPRVANLPGIDTVPWGATVVSDCVILRNQSYPVSASLPSAEILNSLQIVDP